MQKNRSLIRTPLASAFTSALVLGLSLCAPSHAATDETYRSSIEEWRKQSDQKIRAVDGPLAAIGLYWLHDGVNKIGSYPSNEVVLPTQVAPAKAGVIKVVNEDVTFEAADTVPAKLNGEEVKRIPLQKDGETSNSNFNIGRLKLSFVNRELGLAIRVTDPNSATRRDFPGQQWFPVDESWAIEGHFVPFAGPKTLVYEAATGGTRTGISPGYVSFNRDGHEYRLEVQKGGQDAGYIAFFFDASTGKASYAGGRVVPIQKLSGDLVKVDFNKAFNMPCSVSPFYNCQIAPAQNHLTSLDIPAGEKKPLVKVQRVASAPEYIK